MSRAALVALLALTASCNKDAENALPPPPAEQTPSAKVPEVPTPRPVASPTEAPTPTEAPVTTPPPAPSGWAQRSGPGFTVNAPGDGTKTHVEMTERDPAADIYTFHKADGEHYEVRVIPVIEPLSRAIVTLRDRISFSSTQIRGEDYLPTGLGDATGIDIAYIVNEDGTNLYARSRLIGAGTTVYNVRAVFPKQREDVAARFIESFALAK